MPWAGEVVRRGEGEISPAGEVGGRRGALGWWIVNATLVLAVPGLALVLVALWLYRRDAREWSNAIPLLFGVLLILGAALSFDNGMAQSGRGGGLLVLAAVALMGLAPLLVLVFACWLVWNGITIVRREGRSLGNMLSLGAGLAMLALYAYLVVAVFVLDDQRAFLLGLGAILVLCYPSFAFAAYFVAAMIYQRRKERPADHDIIVLGSSVSSGRVPPLLAARLDRAIEQWRADQAAGFTSILIPTGGMGGDEPVSEGEAMATYLVEQGVPADAIIVEPKARNTMENLRFSQELALADGRAQNLVVVTSEFHAMRAAQFCKDLGIPAHVLGGRTARYFLPSAYLREFIALMVRHKWVHLVSMGTLAAMAADIALR